MLSELETYKAIRVAVEGEPLLIRGFFRDENDNACAIGALVPRDQRRHRPSGFYRIFNDDAIEDTAYANNGFHGSDENRRIRMLKWLDRKISKLEPLVVPQFTEAVLV